MLSFGYLLNAKFMKLSFQTKISDETLLHCFRYSIDDPKYTYFYTMSGEDQERMMKAASHQLEDTFKGCKVFGKIANCADVFDVVPTTAGNTYLEISMFITQN